MNKPVVLEAQHVSRRFSEGPLDVSVLQDVNLSVTAGETLAIVGASGSGKSTLVDCIVDAVKTNKGTILISGLTNREAINKWPGAIGYVPQHVSILNSTIRENIIFGLKKIHENQI